MHFEQAGGWVWQMFHRNNASAPLTGSECIAWLRAACTAQSPHQTRMTFYELSIKRHSRGWPTDPTGDVARFLLTRGAYAFLGTGTVIRKPCAQRKCRKIPVSVVIIFAVQAGAAASMVGSNSLRTYVPASCLAAMCRTI